MAIETVFRDFLLQSVGISGLVGTRVFQNRAPQNATYPLIVIRKRDVTPTDDHGYLAGHVETTWRILGETQDFATLVKLREALRGLAGFNQAFAVANGLDQSFQDPGITEIQAVLQVFEADQFNENSGLFVVIVDHNVMHTETVLQGITT